MSDEDKGKRFVFDAKKGTFDAGKARPELLPEHMRILPSDYVTKEIADEHRIHKHDDDHIVTALTKERLKSEAEGDVVAEKVFPTPTEQTRMCLNQKDVDAIIMRVLRAKIHALKEKAERGERIVESDYAVKHLWFVNDALMPRAIRWGNPPADSDRPKHMRGLNLVVDIFNWPREVRAALAAQGITPPSRKDFAKWERKATAWADQNRSGETLQ